MDGAKQPSQGINKGGKHRSHPRPQAPRAMGTRIAPSKEIDTMPGLDVIRAWKDEEYRLSLSEAERALLPSHPAGRIELAEAELDAAVGGGTGGGGGVQPCPQF